MVRFALIASSKITETTVAFLRLKRIAIMVKFPINSEKKTLKQRLDFSDKKAFQL